MPHFARGMQIAYIPLHAEGNINHPDVELGFITSVRSNTAFCRYWRKGHIGELRTLANSEGTPIDMIRYFPSVPQDRIVQLLETM